MKKIADVLGVIGILVITGAIIWHLTGCMSGNPFVLAGSSPSNVAVFGNSLILIAICVKLKK